MIETIPAKLATAATSADGTPGRRMISRSGAGGSGGRRIAEAAEVERDRLRVGTDEQDEHEPDRDDPARREPGDDERVQVQVLAGEERPEDERAERRAEERPEQDEGDPAGASGRADTCPQRPSARAGPSRWRSRRTRSPR